MLRPALIILLLAMLLPGLGCGPSGGRAPVAEFAVVFDARDGLGAGLLLAYTARGIRFETGDGTFECPPAPAVPGGLESFAPDPDALHYHPAVLGPAFADAALSAPSADPDLLESLDDDCDVIEAWDEVLAWLDAVQLEAEVRVAALEACVADAKVAYCDALARIEANVTEDFVLRDESDFRLWMFGAGVSGARPPRSPLSACATFRVALDRLPPLLDLIRFGQARCEDALLGLHEIIDRTGTPITEAQGHARLVAAASLLRGATLHLTEGREKLARIEETVARFVRADVEASCALCGPKIDFAPRPGSGAVAVQGGSAVLPRLLAALEAAEASDDDPKRSARYASLAARLGQTPAHRVLHVTFVGGDPVGVDYVVIGDPPPQDDGVSPLVVVLTARRAGTKLPEPDATDTRRRLQAWHDFVATLLR